MVAVKEVCKTVKDEVDDEKINNHVSRPAELNQKACVEECTYDDALDIAAANGRYQVCLLLTLSLVMVSMAMDMFGFALVVAGCSCEFHLTITQKGILTSMPFAGPIIMAYPWGYISDTRGRRRCLLLATGGSFLVSSLSALAPNWLVLALMKLVGTSFISCAQSACYALLGESCSRQVRGSYLLVMTSIMHSASLIYFTIAYFIINLEFSLNLGFLGQFTPWRLFTIIIALPLGMGFLSLLAFNESPKFLANENRQEEAMHVLKNIWAWNGGDPDTYPVQKLKIQVDEVRRRSSPFLQSVWQQTAPLFKPPLVARTFQLYFITAVIYSTSNSFLMWFPFIANSFFGQLRTSNSSSGGLCDLHVFESNDKAFDTEIDSTMCKLELNTILSGVIQAIAFIVVNLCFSRLAAHKKLVTIGIFLMSAVAGVAVTLVEEPVSIIILYTIFSSTGIGIGLVSSYFVDLFPISYRGMTSCTGFSGMAACLGVMVARSSALLGTNLVGSLAATNCRPLFWAWSLFVFSGAFVSLFLPTDRQKRK